MAGKATVKKINNKLIQIGDEYMNQFTFGLSITLIFRKSISYGKLD